MSRVFLAEETRLGRHVVIKVLPPEMAAGVNVERFEREIQLAAKLQHPHIVPVLSAGASDDILFYVMPFIRGESLRAKLSREGELPVGEAVRILEDVADALAYAHREGVVHRDIKPDNVLLSDNHAVVTDFGVAKAVQSSTGESSLTSLGVALGTPAYMAPEQAAADPHVDHRADIYAMGALAYEMLTGRPPFTGNTPQAVLSAHVTQAPEPVTMHRETVPPALAELVMRCLAKKPADRFQRADELRALFESMTTPSGGVTPTGTQPVPAVDYEAKARRAHPARVGIVFSGVSLVAAGVVYGLMLVLGLPNWVFFAAVGLMALGLPVMLLTGHQERKRAMARATGVHTMTPTGMKKLFTWKRSLAVGGAGFAALALVAGGVMTMRSLGIGPFATLVSSGVLKNKQTVILADFVNRASDSTLGPTLTEAFRVDLAQSPTVTLMDQQAIQSSLQRMQRGTTTKLTPAVAHDVAVREGVSAIVSGQIDPVGTGYVLSASVTATDDGRVLTAVRATASDAGHLIPALDELSRDLREKIGESLVSIRNSQPLAQVTTSSLDALRKYTDALGRFDTGDFEGAEALLKQAVGVDSGFAMAWRKLAAVYSNGGSFAREADAATRAFQLRDRLPPMERDQATAFYYGSVAYDPTQATAAYRTILERDSTNLNALNNLASILNQERDYAGAESLLVRAAATNPNTTVLGNLVVAQARQGHYDDADSTLKQWRQVQPDNPRVSSARANVLAGRGDLDSAARVLRQLTSDTRVPAGVRQGAWGGLAGVALTRGRLADAWSDAREFKGIAEQRGLPAAVLGISAGQAYLIADLADKPAQAASDLAAALEAHPLESIAPADRPYDGLVSFYARIGRLDEARRYHAAYMKDIPESLRRGNPGEANQLASIALAEGRWNDALAQYRRAREISGCPRCFLDDIARTYDKAGQEDSALAYYEWWLDAPGLGPRGPYLGPSLKRLGELYQAKGDRKKALDYYARFVDLWKNADPDLQPVVTDVKARIARLTAEHG